MHRPITKVVTTSGKGGIVILDRYVNGYGVTVEQPQVGGIIYTLQYSNSDPTMDYNGNPYTVSYNASGVWINSDDPVMVNASTTRSTNFAYPPRAIRVNATAKISAGNPLVLQVIPMGMDGN